MSARLLPLDIPGLDLPLGGGLWTLERVPGAAESATVLVRGAPGSGKTVFGFQLAGAVARALKGDVAYGCIELLPVELQAQHAGLRREGVIEEVIVPPFRAPLAGCRIFAGLLDLGASGEEQGRLGLAVNALLSQVEQAGGRPRVLVIDSLSDGYNLGASAPRQLADSLCKLALERGLVLILLEEIAEARPFAWSFAVDVVLELGGAEQDRGAGVSAPAERRLTVIKNRFGPSHAGQHRSTVLPGQGLRVLPHPAAYLEPWASPVLWDNWRAREPERRAHLHVPGVDKLPESPPFRESVVAVYGMKADAVFRVASSVNSVDEPTPSAPLFVDFGSQTTKQPKELPPNSLVLQAGNPFLSGHRLVADVRDALEQVRRQDSLISKVLIGDLRSLRSFYNPEEIRRAIAVVAAMLRRVRVPALIFETTENAIFAPQAADFADVLVDVNDRFSQIQAFLTVRRTGHNQSWPVRLPDPGDFKR